MPTVMDAQRLQHLANQVTRGLILQVLDASHPAWTSETLILSAVVDCGTSVNSHQMRRELDYLAQKNLILLQQQHPLWVAKLSAHGIDYLEHTIEEIPGIHRPQRHEVPSDAIA